MGEHDVRRRAAWRFVRAVIRSQASGVVGAALSGLLWQAGAVSAPLMVKYAIDHGVLTKDRHALLIWLGALLGVGLLEMTAGAVRHLYAIRNRARSDARVRDAIFAHALRLDASYHDRVGPGELMSRASSDSEHVARMMDSIGRNVEPRSGNGSSSGASVSRSSGRPDGGRDRAPAVDSRASRPSSGNGTRPARRGRVT